MAFLGEVRAARAGGFAELALEGEGRKRGQAGVWGRERRKGMSGMTCQRGRQIDLGAGEEKEPFSGDVRV